MCKHSLVYSGPWHSSSTVLHSSITRSRGDTHSVMRLHRGAGTHQTPTEHHTAGSMLHLKKKRAPEGQSQTFQFSPSENLVSSFLTLLVYHVSPSITLPAVKIIIFFHLSLMLSASLRLTQRSGQPSCVTDSKVIRDLAVEATPSVLHLFDSTYARMCVNMCGRERDKQAWSVCVLAVLVTGSPHITTFRFFCSLGQLWHTCHR